MNQHTSAMQVLTDDLLNATDGKARECDRMQREPMLSSNLAIRSPQ